MTCVKLYKDLRGVMTSCNDRRSYNLVYETLWVWGDAVTPSGKPVFELMEQTVDTCGNDDVLLATMLKCLLAFV